MRLSTEWRRPLYELGLAHDAGLDSDFTTTEVRGAWRFHALAFAELGLGRDASRLDGYTVARVAPRLRLRYDMGLLGPTLAKLEHELYVGTFYETTTYDLGAGEVERDHSNGVSAGAEVRYAAAESVELQAGYSHDRTGVTGGTASGFAGSFHAGARLRAPFGAWLFARATAGTPNVYQLGSEYRW